MRSGSRPDSAPLGLTPTAERTLEVSLDGLEVNFGSLSGNKRREERKDGEDVLEADHSVSLMVVSLGWWIEW